MRGSYGGSIPQYLMLLLPETTKPGWLARLSFCGTGSCGLVRSGESGFFDSVIDFWLVRRITLLQNCHCGLIPKNYYHVPL